jgi:hypothetical protein
MVMGELLKISMLLNSARPEQREFRVRSPAEISTSARINLSAHQRVEV